RARRSCTRYAGPRQDDVVCPAGTVGGGGVVTTSLLRGNERIRLNLRKPRRQSGERLTWATPARRAPRGGWFRGIGYRHHYRLHNGEETSHGSDTRPRRQVFLRAVDG